MRNREQQKKPNWLGLAVVFLILAPEIFIPLAIVAAVVMTVCKLAKNAKPPQAGNKTTYTTPADKLDECPKPLFCFHTDKAEHHVRKGKEIDPWDRPDIDIRKYQRKG